MSLVFTVCILESPLLLSENRRSTLRRSCYRRGVRSRHLYLCAEGTYLETPRFFLKLFVPVHSFCDLFKVLFHLVGKAVVQTRQICEARNA